MFWLHIVIIVGLVSIIIPAIFFLLLFLKFNNLYRSLMVTVTSILFTAIVILYIYSDMLLYIMIGLVVLISGIAGLLSYFLFNKQSKQMIKAG